MSDKSRKYNLYPSHISHGNRGAGKSNRTADENEGSSFIDSIKGSVIGAAISLPVAIILLLISSAIAYSMPDPNVALIPISLTITYITFFISGLVSAKINRGSLVVSTMLNWIALSAILLLLSLFFGSSMRSGYSLLVTLVIHMFTFPANLCGVALGLKKKSSPQRTRRKH